MKIPSSVSMIICGILGISSSKNHQQNIQKVSLPTLLLSVVITLGIIISILFFIVSFIING